jgi:hypothetical protein
VTLGALGLAGQGIVIQRHYLIALVACVAIVLSPIAFYSFSVRDMNALVLATSLSQRTIPRGNTLTVTITVRNALPLRNDPPAFYHWAIANMSSGPCDSGYPTGIAVYSGRYSAQNVLSGSSVMIFDYFGYFSCPSFSYDTSFRFGPLEAFSKQLDLNGYWAQGVTAHPEGGVSSGVLHPFPAGEYTVFSGTSGDT